MKYRLVDVLACPICKNFPLVLYVFSEVKREVKEQTKWRCELYCGLNQKYIKELNELRCEECFKLEIVEGLLYCKNCGRWYPIIEEIPHMLPDELRNKKEDLEFLKKYKDRLPEEITLRGKPFNFATT